MAQDEAQRKEKQRAREANTSQITNKEHQTKVKHWINSYSQLLNIMQESLVNMGETNNRTEARLKAKFDLIRTEFKSKKKEVESLLSKTDKDRVTHSKIRKYFAQIRNNINTLADLVKEGKSSKKIGDLHRNFYSISFYSVDTLDDGHLIISATDAATNIAVSTNKAIKSEEGGIIDSIKGFFTRRIYLAISGKITDVATVIDDDKKAMLNSFKDSTEKLKNSYNKSNIRKGKTPWINRIISRVEYVVKPVFRGLFGIFNAVVQSIAGKDKTRISKYDDPERTEGWNKGTIKFIVKQQENKLKEVMFDSMYEFAYNLIRIYKLSSGSSEVLEKYGYKGLTKELINTLAKKLKFSNADDLYSSTRIYDKKKEFCDDMHSNNDVANLFIEELNKCIKNKKVIQGSEFFCNSLSLMIAPFSKLVKTVIILKAIDGSTNLGFGALSMLDREKQVESSNLSSTVEAASEDTRLLSIRVKNFFRELGARALNSLLPRVLSVKEISSRMEVSMQCIRSYDETTINALEAENKVAGKNLLNTKPKSEVKALNKSQIEHAKSILEDVRKVSPITASALEEAIHSASANKIKRLFTRRSRRDRLADLNIAVDNAEKIIKREKQYKTGMFVGASAEAVKAESIETTQSRDTLTEAQRIVANHTLKADTKTQKKIDALTKTIKDTEKYIQQKAQKTIDKANIILNKKGYTYTDSDPLAAIIEFIRAENPRDTTGQDDIYVVKKYIDGWRGKIRYPRVSARYKKIEAEQRKLMGLQLELNILTREHSTDDDLTVSSTSTLISRASMDKDPSSEAKSSPRRPTSPPPTSVR